MQRIVTPTERKAAEAAFDATLPPGIARSRQAIDL
jgi:hypothetical protein